jgi:hypothetical protein
MSRTASSTVTPLSNYSDEDNMFLDVPEADEVADDHSPQRSHGRTSTAWLGYL